MRCSGSLVDWFASPSRVATWARNDSANSNDFNLCFGRRQTDEFLSKHFNFNCTRPNAPLNLVLAPNVFHASEKKLWLWLETVAVFRVVCTDVFMTPHFIARFQCLGKALTLPRKIPRQPGTERRGNSGEVMNVIPETMPETMFFFSFCRLSVVRWRTWMTQKKKYEQIIGDRLFRFLHGSGLCCRFLKCKLPCYLVINI